MHVSCEEIRITKTGTALAEIYENHAVS